MIVRVAGVGESCPDPDRYIQALSEDSAASSGVSQKANIILKPDVPLLIGMGSVLVLAVITAMVGVGYCLHKGWSIPKVNLRGFRNLYLKTDVDHTSEETFRLKNDFSNFKSHLHGPKDQKKGESTKNSDDSLIDEEDDLDDINLDIHLDVLEAGQQYLKIFGDRKHERSLEKQQRKGEIVKMMSEIEKMINLIGSDAMTHQMQIFNEKD